MAALKIALATGRAVFWQWDINQKLVVTGDVTQVHFAQRNSDTALVVAVVDGQAAVPDELLQVAGDLEVYAYTPTGTMARAEIVVRPRQQPADYVYTPTEQHTCAELLEQAAAAIAVANKANEDAQESVALSAESLNGAQSARDAAIAAQSAAESAENDASQSAASAAGNATSATNAAARAESDADSARTARDSALTSAEHAEKSKESASASASAALASQNAAKGSEDSSAASAAAALSSKNAAGTSESNALASKNAASASASAAGVSATNAANSAAAALVSQNAAKTSEDNAAGSAASSLAYKNAAGVSAGNAATSEANALASKNAAGVSAGNAATSEANALASKNAAADSKAAVDAFAQTIVVDDTPTENSNHLVKSGGVYTANKDLGNRLSTLESATVKKYGARKAVDASAPTWERLGDAVGLVANAAVGAGTVVNDFMRGVYPYNRCRPCNLAQDGTVSAYIGDPDYDWYGGNGDVMLEVPIFYSKRYLATEDSVQYEYRWLAASAVDGLTVDPLFWEDAAGENVKQKAYLPIFNGSLATDGATVRSVAGASPVGGKTRAQQRALCTAKGVGWSLDDVWSAFALEHLYIIMFANSDAQTILGQGRTNMPYSNAHVVLHDAAGTNQIAIATQYASLFIVGQQVGLGASYGSASVFAGRTITSIAASGTTGESIITVDGATFNATAGNVLWSCAQNSGETIAMASPNGVLANDGKHAVRFLWIEDWFGNIWQRMDGDNINDFQHYLCHNRNAYADDIYNGGYSPIGYIAPAANGYVKALGCDGAEPMAGITSAVGGASNTYYCDYYYQSSGARAPLRGGYQINDAFAGPFCWHCAYYAADTSWTFGCRPLYK